MILNNLLYNRQPDAASALCGISGCIGTIKPVKDIDQLTGRNALSVVLNLYLNEITRIPDTQLHTLFLFIHIFDGISDDVIDYTGHLFRIRDDQRLRIYRIDVGKLDIPSPQIQSDIIGAVIKIFCHIQTVEVVRNAVRINLRIKGQLIDQPVLDAGTPPTSFQKKEARFLFFAVSVLNPYIAAGILSITGLFGAGPLVAGLFMAVNQVSAGLMGIPGIIWFVAWIMSIARLAEANEA